MKKLFFFLLLLPSFVFGQMFGSLAADDYDANLFSVAAGLTSAAHKDGINYYVKSFKAYGFWSGDKAYYPFVGGTASTHKWNLKDPRDLDAAFRLTFSGTWTHNANGADPDGSTAVCTTHIVPNTHLTQNDKHLSYYSGDALNSTIGGEIGTITNTGNPDLIAVSYSSVLYASISSSTVVSTANTNSTGLWMVSRDNSSTQVYVFRNGATFGSNPYSSTSGSQSTDLITIGKQNNINSDKRVQFASIGLGKSTTEAATFYNIVSAVQTKWGR